MVRRLCGLVVVAATLSAGVAHAQLNAPKKASEVEVNRDARILVATPVLEGGRANDAVEIGIGMRNRFTRIVTAKYTIVTREQMNKVLARYGYKGDEALPPEVLEELAGQVWAGVAVETHAVAGEEGIYTVTARVTGLRNPIEVKVTQAEGQGLKEFGAAIADAIRAATAS